MSNLVTQANFARLHKVSRKAVTTWKNRGYLVFSGQLVDVEQSNTSLANVGRAWPETVTKVAAQVAGSAGGNSMEGNGLPSEACSLSAMCESGACDMSELMLRHLPMQVVRPLVEEFVARARRGATEVLDMNEDGSTPPPPGYASWADHPMFNEPAIREYEWEESAKLAAAHVQAGGAASDA